MLFNSAEFLFVFLPATLVGYFLVARLGTRTATAWLVLASLIFYASWNYGLTLLLLASITFNFLAGRVIAARRRPGRRNIELFVAVAVNLAALAYFKYANFFLQNLTALTGTSFAIRDIVLPLGISFFTFTQIAFLVDVAGGLVAEYDFLHYVLFVTYFPHLIAGPILHHGQMMPQFDDASTHRVDWKNIACGLTIFSIGLAKKVVVADSWSEQANAVFAYAHSGGSVAFFDAWTGALAYAVQLYFDFSGYSDMAIGISLLFNIRLPINFDSPYKATSVIDFWRRWHISLSTFLRDYLYIPLGGNKRGRVARHRNLMATMLLGGLWHGAGWTYVVWGGLHGLYLMINHGWRALAAKLRLRAQSRIATLAAGAVTFAAVVFAWVVFRAPDMASALNIWKGMVGANGVSVPAPLQAKLLALVGQRHAGGFVGSEWTQIANVQPHEWLIFAVIWLAPNVMDMFGPHIRTPEDALDPPQEQRNGVRLRWTGTYRWAAAGGLLLAVAIMRVLSGNVSEFLYFQF